MKFAIVSILLYVFSENHLSVSARSLRKLSKGSKGTKVKNYNYETNPVSTLNRADDDITSSDDADDVEYPQLMFGENSDELLADCRGDCDSDDECETGLICVQRNGYEEMPGCAGEPSWNTDYCLNPARNFKELAYWGQDGPFGRCAGDCGECIYLFCVDWIGRSRKYSLAFVWVALDCIHIFLLDLFALLFHSDTFFSISKDNDSDCVGNLICFQRDGEVNNVPGCPGRANDNVDYCIAPPTPAPTPPFINRADDCIQCQDKQTPYMKSKGISCKEWAMTQYRCTEQSPYYSFWKQERFCELSCAKKRFPYPGPSCCGV